MSYGSLWQRWARGVSWTWINERYRGAPARGPRRDVMTLESRDRFHAKQGRSTARVVFHAGIDGPDRRRRLSVYLKRHFRLPWPARLAALVDPAGRHSPAAAEWAHLERGRALGIDVPEVVAAGERIGPRAGLTSFLMVAELTGCEAVHEVLPSWPTDSIARAFAVLKRRVIAEMARITATLHAARVFHKDLYLCHFFLDHRSARARRPAVPARPDRPAPAGGASALARLVAVERPGPVAVFDLRRRRHQRPRPAPILEVVPAGASGSRCRRWQARIVRLRAARYREHNRKPR